MATADYAVLGGEVQRGGAITEGFVGEFKTFHITCMFPDPINPDSADMDDSVANDTFWTAAETDQRRWLKSICTEHVDPSHATKEIVKGITLNHLQMERLIGRLNVQNGITATAVKRLTLLAVGLAALQVLCAGFFIWRDFHPRNVAVDEPTVSQEAERDTRPSKDESPRLIEPVRK